MLRCFRAMVALQKISSLINRSYSGQAIRSVSSESQTVINTFVERLEIWSA